jgi:hypothetical protein
MGDERGVGGQSGSQCRCSGSPGGCFGAGDGVVAAVVNDVGSFDGGCAQPVHPELCMKCC